ncbi:Holliday junction resolvase RuvX [Methylobacillus caricis]|uniref:Holliday junction resolvase RuvX n=1 Tax=Methylobacillus caricis TaxID=1971611 RepID=UPI001CFFAA07|nr:Holliday junction resolvase RuvX [Methylobacillus caricis]MCB5188425.1 Holliday junction resolvase RuvX [Methylobacillus caricis]
MPEPSPESSVSAKEGCVLGFDFGEKRIGVAIGEHLLGIAHPLQTIEAEANDKRFGTIANLIAEWHPVALVVGLPLYLNGDEHALTLLCRKFARRLEGRFNLPVIMVDERLSSVEASHALKETGIFGRKQKPLLDQVAAQHILQSYFDGLAS